MAFIKIIVLAIVQGITEFLPISSDGHLAITQLLLNIHENNLALTVGLHAGTVLSIIVYYLRDLWDLGLRGIPALFGRGSDSGEFTLEGRRRVVLCIIVGSIPTGIIGLLLRDPVEAWTSSSLLVGLFLIATGGMNAVVAWRSRTPGGRRAEEIRIVDALVIGAAQGLAVLPGLSRSGSTIAAGTALGLNKEFAARFSFLLSVPAVVGAIGLYAKDLTGVDGGVDPLQMAIGLVVAFAVGIGALHLLIKLLEKGRFGIFAIYCFLLGPLVMILGYLDVL